MEGKELPGHDIIVIGASAGGIEALNSVLKDIPPGIPAAIFIVMHIPAQSPSMLPSIFSRAGQLPAFHGLDGAKIEYGRIYVAPPDYHLLLENGYMRILRGPRENRHRPAVDPLFRTAAAVYGPRVIGVILSGALDDGTAGLLAVKRQGGVAIAQDPHTALYPSMPRSAMENVQVDYCLPLNEIGSVLEQLAHQEVIEEGGSPIPGDMDKENRIVKLEPEQLHGPEQPGTPSVFSCPECGGVLWEIPDEHFLRFRCRVGHAFSAQSVLAEQGSTLEEALWVALKTLEENANLARRLAEQSIQRNHPALTSRYEARAQDAWQKAEIIRRTLLQKDNNESFNTFLELPDELPGEAQQPISG